MIQLVVKWPTDVKQPNVKWPNLEQLNVKQPNVKWYNVKQPNVKWHIRARNREKSWPDILIFFGRSNKLWPAISIFKLPKMELANHQNGTIKEIIVFLHMFLFFLSWLTYLVRAVNSGVNSVKKLNLLNSNKDQSEQIA